MPTPATRISLRKSLDICLFLLAWTFRLLSHSVFLKTNNGPGFESLLVTALAQAAGGHGAEIMAYDACRLDPIM